MIAIDLWIDHLQVLLITYHKLIKKNQRITWDLWCLHYHSLLIKYDRLIKKKISQIDKKDWKNEFIGSMRSIMASLSQSIDKVSEANKRYRLLNEVKSFLIHIDFAIEISINFLYY